MQVIGWLASTLSHFTLWSLQRTYSMMRFCKQGTPSLQAKQILFTTANAMSNNKTYSGRPKNPAYKFALWKFKFIVFHLNLSKVRERCVIIRNWPRSEIGREKKWYNSPKVDYRPLSKYKQLTGRYQYTNDVNVP